MPASASSPPQSQPHLPEHWEPPSTIWLKQGDATVMQALSDADQQQACLILYSGDDAGRRFALPGGRTVLGRSPSCEVCIDSPGVSRCHAELLHEGDHFMLHDRGSVNGTHVNGVRLGAARALQDGDLISLGNVVLKFYERQSLDALLHDRTYRLATVDASTDVYTKRYLLEALEREVRRAHRTGQPLSVVCIDLDRFKAVNDRFGHNGGDIVLRVAAAALKTKVRGSDILGRTGGEEFVVVLPETGLRAALDLAERMRAAVAAELFLLDVNDAGGTHREQHRQTASFGVAQLVPTMPDARALLGAADQMLYSAKHGGRNRVAS
ncbi:MAG: GGDEF domain-containing protein [Rubrivivax sp.]|nr:GGDEF domain-containing protein [Rubrivivax sp.]